MFEDSHDRVSFLYCMCRRMVRGLPFSTAALVHATNLGTETAVRYPQREKCTMSV